MSELKPRHTPGKWITERSRKLWTIKNEAGAFIARIRVDWSEHGEANAERIVLCVNAHDGLVEALELAEIWLMQCIPIVEIDGPKPLPVIRAALAQAKGGEDLSDSVEERCSHKGPHLSHTFGGRPAIYCPGIAAQPHKPDCPVMKGHHSLMCSCNDEPESTPAANEFEGLKLPDDFMVTVCKACKRACCWQGEFMCQDARFADICDMTVGDLKALQPSIDGEHWEWWEKDVAALEFLSKRAAHVKGEDG